MLSARNKVSHVIAGVCIFCCLLMVWVPDSFVTGDGPCHLYNAKVLLDVWMGRNTTFYFGFLSQNMVPNPNWASHVLLAALMTLFDPFVSEKILISGYVLLMAGGVYVLLRNLNRKISFWSLSAFILVFHHCLFKGFYNFSLSTAICPWLLLTWLMVLKKSNLKSLFLFFTVSAVVFFTQLLPYAIGLFACGCLTFSRQLVLPRFDKDAFARAFLKKIATLVILNGPFLYLMVAFTRRMGGLQLVLKPHLYRLWDLLSLRYLIGMAPTERFFTAMAALTTFSLLIVAAYKRLRLQVWLHQWDGLWAMLFVSLLVYFFFPEDFLGRAILISMRMQLFVLLFALCCVSVYAPYFVRNAGGLVLLFCFVGLSMVRLPVMLSAAKIARDIQIAARNIKSNAVVLPLLLSPTGSAMVSGHGIATENYLFTHIGDYAGVNAPVVMLDNYEANTGYFPFNWKDARNPYHLLNFGNGFEGMPPCASISGYTNKTGVQITYILTTGMDTSIAERRPCAQLLVEINEHYKIVFSSGDGNVRLYRLIQ